MFKEGNFINSNYPEDWMINLDKKCSNSETIYSNPTKGIPYNTAIVKPFQKRATFKNNPDVYTSEDRQINPNDLLKSIKDQKSPLNKHQSPNSDPDSNVDNEINSQTFKKLGIIIEPNGLPIVNFQLNKNTLMN